MEERRNGKTNPDRKRNYITCTGEYKLAGTTDTVTRPQKGKSLHLKNRS